MNFNLYKFFDYFGIIAFTFLIADALLDIQSGTDSLKVYLRLLIGVGGFLIDGYLVFFYRPNK